MNTALMSKTQSERKSNAIETTVLHDQDSCSRWGGLLVREVCMDLFNPTGELEVFARRCVQCGVIVDPVILANRALVSVPHLPSASKSLEQLPDFSLGRTS
jgi:hypothetical protein